jgi:hypothetical protein
MKAHRYRLNSDFLTRIQISHPGIFLAYNPDTGLTQGQHRPAIVLTTVPHAK